MALASMTTAGTGPDMSGPMWMPVLPPTVARVLAWHPQPVPVLPVLGGLLLLAYLAGTLTLARRRIRWPVGRTVFWVLGVASFLAVTGTGIDGYGMELFSIHMIQHMVLSMLSPVLLALGAPVTLLLRSLPAGPGKTGVPRRALLRALHTAAARLLAHPAVTVVLFLMSLYGLYFTPVFDYLMSTWWGHNLMLIHFLVIGLLYFWAILGVDPSPRRGRRGVRRTGGAVLPILELAATTPFHAFFGVVVMMSTELIVRFYATAVPGWHITPLADQALGGGIAWGFTELPTLLVLGALVMKWQKSDQRSTRAAERRAARTGDAELETYNAYLQSLDRRTGPDR